MAAGLHYEMGDGCVFGVGLPVDSGDLADGQVDRICSVQALPFIAVGLAAVEDFQFTAVREMKRFSQPFPGETKERSADSCRFSRYPREDLVSERSARSDYPIHGQRFTGEDPAR